MERLKDIDLFILDMDGTIYIENKVISGADDFLSTLISSGKKYVFLTNNSSINQNDYLDKLKGLEIKCSKNQIYSSGIATGMYLMDKWPDKRVYVVGTKALEEELIDFGVEITETNPDIVLVGFDRELSYEKIEKACSFLDNGAEFIATNPDLLYPLRNKRFIPDCGSICQMLTNATNKTPMYIGKPNRYIIDIIIERERVGRNKVALIGDRLYTDIAAGLAAKVLSVLVLTGETNIKMLRSSKFKPDVIIESVKDLRYII